MIRSTLALFLFATACAQVPRAPRAPIEYLGSRFELDDSVPIKNHRLGDVELWISVFALENGADPEVVRDRRVKAFQNLFYDERDPYTGKTNGKSKCLKASAKNKFAFSSGEAQDWAGCQLTKAPKPAYRTWLVCDDKLVEITVRAPLSSQIVSDPVCNTAGT